MGTNKEEICKEKREKRKRKERREAKRRKEKRREEKGRKEEKKGVVRKDQRNFCTENETEFEARRTVNR